MDCEQDEGGRADEEYDGAIGSGDGVTGQSMKQFVQLVFDHALSACVEVQGDVSPFEENISIPLGTILSSSRLSCPISPCSSTPHIHFSSPYHLSVFGY